MQKFIFEKKSSNVSKYHLNSKINETALPVPKGTVSIMLNIAKKDFGFSLSSLKKQIPKKSKFKMKWKAIQWLNNNKHEEINVLCKNFDKLLQSQEDKKKGLTRQAFGELLSSVGLGSDINVLDKLFYVFDEDGDGTVDYKELIVGLEAFKDSTIDEKIKMFLKLCDQDKDGSITEQELYNVLKRNVQTLHEKKKMRKIVKQIFTEADEDGNGVLDQEELYAAASKNGVLRNILEQNVQNFKKVDKMIENDLEEPFHCWIPISANFVNFKEGIHFPLVDKLFDVIKENEDKFYQSRLRKIQYKDIIRKRLNMQEEGDQQVYLSSEDDEP